jgi:hypothetical protein
MFKISFPQRVPIVISAYLPDFQIHSMVLNNLDFLPNILGYIAIMDITKSTAILSRGLSFCYYFPSNISAEFNCPCGNDCVLRTPLCTTTIKDWRLLHLWTPLIPSKIDKVSLLEQIIIAAQICRYDNDGFIQV